MLILNDFLWHAAAAAARWGVIISFCFTEKLEAAFCIIIKMTKDLKR